MSGLKDTKRRIGSVKNTQKITRAMKLVSAAKYARANQAALKSRPYGDSFDQLVKRLAKACDENIPLLEQRDEKKILLVVVATDRGLCGGLNTNLFKKVTKFLNEKQEQNIKVELVAWGRRAQMFCKKREEIVISEDEKVTDPASYTFAARNAKEFSENFIDCKYDKVFVTYAKFENALTQTPTVEQILPVSVSESEEEETREFVFEPEMKSLLEGLLEKQVASKVFRIFLDASASEHAARMTAMDSATTNADEVIKKLTLDYNRARQAAITSELIEITSGAEAL